ncbi:unnamed protein product [Rhizoctonia solani]|uniref:NACHT domain-containing protein n=1 Tax=Rhizoctonia solani TaxID=456999 RepID=A0A8H2X1U3_9AGAM|nr:unnamed protein product [Rhizoctonia solani]
MPPRTSKRVKDSCTVDNESDSHDTTSTPALTPETLGRKGFFALPSDIIYLIFFNYSEIRIEDILVNPTSLPGHFLDRFKALRNLSQLCQLSRKMYLPLLWERVQVCIATKGAWYREHGNNLVRKCNGLLESQYLWPYIRTITVCLTRFETNRVIPPFVRLLNLLPNVQTLEIPHAHGSMTKILKHHFGGNIFPSIQTVVLPTCAHEILRCCPGIRDITCNEGDGGTLVSAMVNAGCSSLEVMNGIVAGPLQMKRLVKKGPSLRRIRINVRMKDPEKTIQSFSSFPSLRVIEIDTDGRDIDPLLKIASDTLRNCTEQLAASTKGRKGPGFYQLYHHQVLHQASLAKVHAKMTLNTPKPNPKPMRHRIAGIELGPSTYSRQISVKILVDGLMVTELPWIKEGDSLEWHLPIVCNAFVGSKVTLELQEKHTLTRNQSFLSQPYSISEGGDQDDTQIAFEGAAWNATVKFLTLSAAERLYDDGLQKLKTIRPPQTPNVLDRLGKARPVFKSLLEFGQAVSELHPSAKLVFAVCVRAWEKLEEQEGYDESVQALIEGLIGMSELVSEVKNRTQLGPLKKTIEEVLVLIEDVAMFVVDRQSQLSRNRVLVSTFWALVDSGSRDKARKLISKFKSLKARFNMGIKAETHGMIHAADLRHLLKELQPVVSGKYDPETACQEGTRECIISSVMKWSKQSTKDEGMLWVSGQAGIGKSSIASSVCKLLAGDKVLVSSFFCKRDVPSLRDPLRLINSIAHELAAHCPAYNKALTLAIKDDSGLCSSHMQERYEELIKKPLQGLKGANVEPTGSPLIVLIDGLDECGSEDSRRSVLKHLWDMSQLVPWLKIIVTSRPSGGIQTFFNDARNSGIKFLELSVHDYDASEDIRAYIHKELSDLANRDKWPEGRINGLCEKAGGIFIWAATANKYIKGSMGSTLPRLEKLLENKKSIVSDNLDTLYTSVILDGMKDQEEDNKDLIRRCIGAIVIASTRRPLSIPDLSNLLLGKIDYVGLEQVVNSLSSVLHIDKQLDGAVRFYHPSFADYATDPGRSGDFYIDPDKRHEELSEGCLRVMKMNLRFNICELESSYQFNRKIEDLKDRIASKISTQLSYGCTYWISHLVEAPKGFLLEEVNRLISGPLLMYWLEVLSLVGHLDVALEGLPRLIAWLPPDADETSKHITDAYKFVSAFFEPIASSTPHLYVSALALAPKQSLVAQNIRPLFPNTVYATEGGDDTWPQWLRAVPHPGSVTSMSISPDEQKFATGCDDGTISTWDLITGSPMGEQLSGHSLKVMSLAFSPDGRRLASGSLDKKLKVWDTRTGNTENAVSIEAHFNAVASVAFAPSGELIASGSWDRTVRLWSAVTAASIITPIIGHSAAVTAVAFSPDGAQIISGSWDCTVRMWDTKTGVAVRIFPGHVSDVTCVAFSPDGSRIASGSKDKTIRVWDLRNGDKTGTPLYGHFKSVKSIAFSSDGTFIVSGSKDQTVQIWDAHQGTPIGHPLLGHDRKVSSVAFLPSGLGVISGSHDQTVRMWELKSPSGAPNMPVGHSLAVTSVACSPNGHFMASGSDDMTIRIWDFKTGGPIGRPLVGHSLFVSSVAFSPDGALVASGSYDNSIRVWDFEQGNLVGKQLFGHHDSVTSVAFSPGGDTVASGSLDKTVRLWNFQKGCAVGRPFIGHSGAVSAIAFSPDGASIVSSSHDKTVRLWDVTDPINGVKTMFIFNGHSNFVTSVAFSPDGSQIVSGSVDKTVSICDVKTGERIEALRLLHSKPVTSVAVSPNGLYIASASWDKTIKLWDAKTGQLVGSPILGHSSGVTSIAFSPDSRFLVSSSDDKSIRTWYLDANTTIPAADQLNAFKKPKDQWPSLSSELPLHIVYSDWACIDPAQGSLLLWLPVNYRRPHDTRAKHCISADPSSSLISFDFSKFAYGDSWELVQGHEQLPDSPEQSDRNQSSDTDVDA